MSKTPIPQLLPGRRNMAAHCSGCVFTAVSVHLDGLNAEDKFRVWVTILGHTPLPFPLFFFFLSLPIAKWEADLSVNWDHNFWSQICLKTFELIRNPGLQLIQYKILHRVHYTGHRMFRMGFTASNNCSHCKGACTYWPCWAPIGGWGAFGSPGPGPGRPWYGRLPVEPAGLPPRHPGASTLWLSEVPPSGYPLPFSGWRPRLSLRWFSWGFRALGGPQMFGARVFSMPASYLAGWGCCSPHTLLNIYMEEPYEHKRAHTHRCTLKHSHWCKNRCSQTHIVLICCCFKTYFVILVMCAAQ